MKRILYAVTGGVLGLVCGITGDLLLSRWMAVIGAWSIGVNTSLLEGGT